MFMKCNEYVSMSIVYGIMSDYVARPIKRTAFIDRDKADRRGRNKKNKQLTKKANTSASESI